MSTKLEFVSHIFAARFHNRTQLYDTHYSMVEELEMTKIKVKLKQLSIAMSRDILLLFLLLCHLFMIWKFRKLCFSVETHSAALFVVLLYYIISSQIHTCRLNKMEWIWLAPSIKMAAFAQFTTPIICINKSFEALSNINRTHTHTVY